MNAADSIDNNAPKNVPLGHEESGQGKILVMTTTPNEACLYLEFF